MGTNLKRLIVIPMVVLVTVPGKVITILRAVSKNTNIRFSRFVSMQYTDFSLVQQWYAAGNEVAERNGPVSAPPNEIAVCAVLDDDAVEDIRHRHAS